MELTWRHKTFQELDYDISRLFLYYKSRCYKDEQNVDRGAVLNFVLQSLNETGVCSGETWPYNTNRIYEKPPQAAYNEAQDRTISKFEYVPTDLDTWKSVLADGYPILIECPQWKRLSSIISQRSCDGFVQTCSLIGFAPAAELWALHSVVCRLPE